VKKVFGFLTFLLVLGFPMGAQAQQPIRVKCGGASFTDSKGQIWQADTGYNTGSAYTDGASVSGTPDPALYQTGRSNSSGTSLIYTFPVANGNYHVNLYFAETSGNKMFRVGARVFNVKLQNAPAFSNLDVFASAGADAALVEATEIVVSNNAATLEFDNLVSSARINAIEILPISNTAPTLSLNFLYPDGTMVAGNLSYTITSNLLSFRGSVPLVNGRAQSTLLTSPAVLGLNVGFQVNLSLSDATGNLLWQFTLGMNPSQINLGAVQSSALTVVVQKP
jgi:hypothetical protein